MSQDIRGSQGTATIRGREPVALPESQPNPPSPANLISAELFRSLAEVKGQAQGKKERNGKQRGGKYRYRW